MAAATVLNPPTIPGLNCSPTVDQLRKSITLYDNLPGDEEQPEIAKEHLIELAQVFKRYHVEDKFGLHLIHGHFKVSEDGIMLGQKIEDPQGVWTKPTPICGINLGDIHGHIFMLTNDDQLMAYEYRTGPLTNIDSVDPGFFDEFVGYLKAHRLTTLLGLEVMSQQPRRDMAEFVLENSGTVMLDADNAKVGSVYRVTGWTVEDQDGITSFKGGQSHAKTTKDAHKVFIDGKPLPTAEALRTLLKNEGII